MDYPIFKTPAFDQSEQPKISIFIACYNEQEGILNSIKMVYESAQELGLSYQILVGDDCSKDDSVKIVKKFIEERPEIPLLLFVRQINQGLAQNYIEGAFIGTGEYYRLVCGDDVEYKEDFKRILKEIGKADMVVPVVKDIKNKTPFRKWLSRTYIRVINTVSGYRMNYYNGAPVLKRWDVMRWHTNYRGFGFQADMVVRLLEQNRNYVEVEVVGHEREGGKSQALTLMNILSVSHTILDIFIRRFGTYMYKWVAKKKKQQQAQNHQINGAVGVRK